MSDFEENLKQFNTPVATPFENENKSPVAKFLEKNPVISAAVAFASVAALGRGRAFQRIATSMQQNIQGFYGPGVTKFNKAGAFLREAFRGVNPASRQVFDQRLNRAYKQYGFGAGQKRDLDRIFKGYNIVLSDKKFWHNGAVGGSKGLTEEGAKIITQLGKEELGVMHNAFAQQVKIHGLKKAKKMDLYNLIKGEAEYFKYGKGPSAEGAKTKLFKDLGLKDSEVGNIALSKWNKNLPEILKGHVKGVDSINIAKFRHSAMQPSVRNTQFSSQAKIAFLAHEAGLMNKGKSLKGLADFFHKRGYGEEIIKKAHNHYIVKGKTYVANLHKTQKGSVLVNFSPAGKSNYHWGGFNGNLVFNETAKHQRGKVGIFGTDVYDIEILKMQGDKLANFRKTPLLNVQTVKYKDVPIINPDKVPKRFVQRKPREVKKYNRKVFNDEKLQSEMDNISSTGKYGAKQYKEISPEAKQRFELLNRPTFKRAKTLPGGAIEDYRGPLSTYTRHTVRWNKAVEDYYKLYTKSMNQTLTPMERAKFISTRSLLGLPPLASYGAYKYFTRDED